MSESEALSVLQRMTAAGRDAAPGARAVLPARALASGFSRAAEAAMSMAVVATSSSEWIGGLPDLLEKVPENGLLAVLEGPEEAQGLMSFDSALLSAVIEKQMTGGLSAKAPPPRQVTRTDAALAADLIDATLREFEAPLLGRPEARWASGFGYSSQVEDVRPLGLLLEEIDYRIFDLELDLEKGCRQGRAMLAVPSEGRGEIGTSAAHAAAVPPRDAVWQEGLEAAVLGADVCLEAIMHRVRLPFSEVRKLRVGDELPLPTVSIDRVRLVALEGGTSGMGRLGQSCGHRAVRIATLGNVPPSRDRSPATVVSASGLPGDDGDAGGLDAAQFGAIPAASGGGEPALPSIPTLPSVNALDLPLTQGGQTPADSDAELPDLPPLASPGGLPDLPPLPES